MTISFTRALLTAAMVTAVGWPSLQSPGRQDEQVRSDAGKDPAGGIRFIHDSRPLLGIPREARDAGTTPLDDPSPADRASGVTFRVAVDLKDYGALRNVIGAPVKTIRIRYFDPEQFDLATAQTYLTKLVEGKHGSTQTHVFWAEFLDFPLIEAYLYTENETLDRMFSERPGNVVYLGQNAAYLGYLLVWHGGRMLYRDAKGQWWFST